MGTMGLALLGRLESLPRCASGGREWNLPSPLPVATARPSWVR